MAWRQTGTSSNITFYDEGTPRNLWVEVLANDLEKFDGKWRSAKVPRYRITVYRSGVGELGEFEYSPRRKPRSLAGTRLPARTVARLVGEHGYE